ncbi:DNA excision repair protein ERCC-1 isoform X2 [Poecile atricapillus]|uniref:DNA excision repair protein ERCC-1 isoform X2 n=1 Tax=Poecile atricapillus TaxID=48891 RepID=UPI002739C088|nr:DNA excision repair protein ERCC-1 isoform X2 [Poecile atricapillus]
MDPDPDPNPGSAADPEPAAEPEPAPAPAGKRRRFTLRQEGPEEPPVPSLFRAGAAAPPVPVPVPVPPGAGSYAEFVVRGSGSTGRAQPGAERNRGEREQNRERDRDREQNRDQNRDREQNRDQNREVPALPVLKPGTRSSSIIVSPRQRGNPVLRFIRNVPWEFGDVVPDYVLGQSSCALFLSLRYHQLHPEYIHERLRALGRSFSLQVLLLQVDVRDPLQALQDLARICLLSDCTLLLAWSAEESGRYLETFKCYEQKPPDLLRERVEPDFLSRVSDCLTSVRSVNRSDALALLGTFGSLAAVAAASPQDLSLCPGVGPQKARRLFDVLHQPFLKSA